MKTKHFTFLLLFLIACSSFGQPVLHWRFADPVTIHEGTDLYFQFDVEVCATESATFHLATMVYFNYNTDVFGTAIQQNGKFTYTMLDLLSEQSFGLAKYRWVNTADNTPSRVALTFESSHNTPGNPLFMTEMPLYPNFGKFVRCKIKVSAMGNAGINFAANNGYVSLMDGNQFYRNLGSSANLAYGVEPENEAVYENDLNSFAINMGYTLNLNCRLEGPNIVNSMTTNLNSSGYLPLVQPYSSVPWQYTGTEAVSNIPTSDVVDWVLLELRDAPSASLATSSTIIKKMAAFIKSDGSIVGVDGISLPIFTENIVNNLYVVVRHRNHIAIMSASPLGKSGNTYSYSFATGEGQVYGGMSGHKEISPGIWGMISGDGNADGQVMNTDKLNVWSVQVGQSGYLSGDFNMDGAVGNPDKIYYWTPNVGKSCQVPE